MQWRTSESILQEIGLLLANSRLSTRNFIIPKIKMFISIQGLYNPLTGSLNSTAEQTINGKCTPRSSITKTHSKRPSVEGYPLPPDMNN